MRTTLFVLLALILFAPMLNQIFGIVESAPLLGAVKLAKDTSISAKGWWAGTYQEEKAKYFNDNVGFHSDFVRLNNQVEYSLFNRVHANGVIVGKQDYLYESGYITAWYGTDFIGNEVAREKMHKLKFVNDTLAKMGKKLIIAFAPSKGRYYPEFFPSGLNLKKNRFSNYAVLKSLCDSLNIANIDFDGWFLKMKGTSRQPLMTKQGIHWSYYGVDIIADSFNRFLSAQLGIKLPGITWNDKETSCSDQPRGTDNDIAQGLNIIWPVAKETFCYHNLKYLADSNAKKPKMIFIADSFFWTLISRDIPKHSYDWEYWNYFNEIWTQDIIDGKGDITHIRDNTWMDHLKQSDAVVILSTEPNLTYFGFGFIEQAYDRFHGK